MSKKRKRYSSSEKAQVVLEILREDSTINEIAQKHGISPHSKQIRTFSISHFLVWY